MSGARSKPKLTRPPHKYLPPTGFAYVAHSKCGHVNFLAVEPHQDETRERESLWDDLQHYIVSGGYIRRVAREELADIKLDLCSCPPTGQEEMTTTP